MRTRFPIYPLILLLAVFPSFAEGKMISRDFFEEGKRLYRQRELGDALVSFRKAVEDRRTSFALADTKLQAVLSSEEAKKAGPSISALIELFAEKDLIRVEFERMRTEAGNSLKKLIPRVRGKQISDSFGKLLDVLDLVLCYAPQERIQDSLDTLRLLVARFSRYPEAEYRIGMIFGDEGETALEEAQYRKAYDMRESFEVAEDVYPVLFSLARLYRTQRDYLGMEESLKTILKDDPAYEDESNSFLREVMIRTLSREGIDRFLSVYRSERIFALDAYAELGLFYYTQGRYPLAVFHLAFAADILATRIMGELKAERPEYVFSSLTDLFARIEVDESRLRYARERGMPKLFYYLGAALYAHGFSAQAKGIFRPLAASGLSAEWRALAARQLSAPFIEPIVENP